MRTERPEPILPARSLDETRTFYEKLGFAPQLVALVFMSMPAAGKLMSQITGTTLLAQIEAGTAPTILDVRSRWEFADGHVPGALHIPFWTLLTRISEIPTSPADPVVVYCGHGPRAYMAGAALWVSGFRRVVYLRGHMLKWRQAGLRQEVDSRSR